MGWRGTLRSLTATARAAERHQRRRSRELQKGQQQLAKLNAAQRAAHEVAVHENYIELITSVHRDCSDTWNWVAVKSAAPPTKPEYSNRLEIAQREREPRHRPGFWDRVKGQAEHKLLASERAIEQAKAADIARYDEAVREYEQKLEDWKSLQRVADGVIAGDVTAFEEALEELNPFGDIKELGRAVQMSFNQRSIEANIRLYGPEQMPREIKSLLKNGTVSTKPASDFHIHQLYQKHVCSCILRVARELFAVLPFEKVFVHGTADLLNPQTGNKEPQLIASVLIPRTTYDTLNLDDAEAVDCMRNFVHQIAFSKSKGFSPVAKLGPRDYEEAAPCNQAAQPATGPGRRQIPTSEI